MQPSSTLSGTLNSLSLKAQRALPVLKAAPVSVYIHQICTVIDGRVQRSSGRHSSTRDHLVNEGLWELGGGERVVLALGVGSGSIDNRPTVGLSRWANCIRRCSLCPRCQHSMTAVVLSCTRTPLVSAVTLQSQS